MVGEAYDETSVDRQKKVQKKAVASITHQRPETHENNLPFCLMPSLSCEDNY